MTGDYNQTVNGTNAKGFVMHFKEIVFSSHDVNDSFEIGGCSEKCMKTWRTQMNMLCAQLGAPRKVIAALTKDNIFIISYEWACGFRHDGARQFMQMVAKGPYGPADESHDPTIDVALLSQHCRGDSKFSRAAQLMGALYNEDKKVA